MRRKIIAGGGVIVRSERQVAADSARWSGNRKRAFPKQKQTVNSSEDENSAEKQFSEFLQRLRKFGTSNYTSPTRGTST